MEEKKCQICLPTTTSSTPPTTKQEQITSPSSDHSKFILMVTYTNKKVEIKPFSGTLKPFQQIELVYTTPIAIGLTISGILVVFLFVISQLRMRTS